ncbi:MAG: hypothetical protein L0211_16325, partial [Planctomycetaceae bacterium]|nr:hypothetical protein [Planctomycetaceae bacterium]
NPSMARAVKERTLIFTPESSSLPGQVAGLLSREATCDALELPENECENRSHRRVVLSLREKGTKLRRFVA